MFSSSGRFLLRQFFTVVLFLGAGALAALGAQPPRRDANEASTMAGQRHAQLVAEIAHHDRLYFGAAAPEITDAAYDALRRELSALEERYPELAATRPATADVGDDRTGAFATHRHREPMGSLAKVRTAAELREFHRRLADGLGRENLEYLVEPKLDGLAVSVTYERGTLVRAVTRGNGVEGDDITANVLRLTSLPRTLKRAEVERSGSAVPERIELRGEIYVSWSAFRQFNREREEAGLPAFATPRNLAAGTVRQTAVGERDGRALEIAFFAFAACEPESAAPATQQALHERLRAWGLPSVPSVRAANGPDEICSIVELMGLERHDADFPTDGVVVKLNEVALQRKIGASNGTPRWAVAFKFPAERAETRVLAIVLQVGRSGVLTPVAELEPVRLSGSTVSRVTLHNATEVARKDVRVGDVVVIEKAGDVVPALASVVRDRRSGGLARYVFPRECPACGATTVQLEEAVAIRCPEFACGGRLRRRLEHFASAAGVGIDGLGTATVELLVSRAGVRSPADLYRLRRDDLLALGRGGERWAEQLLAAIERSKRAELWRFVHGLGIPSVGVATSRNLAERFGSLGALASAKREELMRVAGVGDATAREVEAFFAEAGNRELVAEFSAFGVAPTLRGAGADGVLAGKRFVLTGTLAGFTRDEMTAKIAGAGGSVGGAVSRTTDFVVVGVDPGAKLDQARELGVRVIDEGELLRMLGEETR